MDNAPEITVLQLPKFEAEATELIGADGIEAVAVHLIAHPDAGVVIYAKNLKTELTTDEKKELRQIAAHLQGVQ